MNARNPIIRFVLFLILIVAFQRALAFLLALTPLRGIWYFIVFELIVAIFFAYLYFPAPERKGCIRNPRFHAYVAAFFAVFVLLELIF